MKRQNNNNGKWREPPAIKFLISGGSREGPGPPHIFRPNWGPKVRIPPIPYLRLWMTGPPLTKGLDPPLLIPMIVIAKTSLRI